MSVQSAHNSTNSAVNSLAATLGVAVGNNNLVRGFVTWGTGTTTHLATVADDKGNSYTIVDKVADTNDGICIGSFYKEGITNGPTVITATLGVSLNATMTIVVSEESGMATASALDAHAGQAQVSPGTGTDAISSGNGTTTQNGDLVCSGVMRGATALTNTAVGTSFTARESDTASLTQIKTEDLTQGSFGAIAGTWTDATSGGSSVYTTLMMAFKTASTAVTGTGPVATPTRAGRGPGRGPAMRRMAPQQFPTPGPTDAIIPGPQIQPLRSRGPGMGPRLRRMVPQRYPDGIASAAPVTGKIGAYSWAGVAAPLSVIVAATVGTYTWSGKSSSLSTEILGKVGAYSWAGKISTISTSIRSTPGAYTWAGKTSSLAASLVSRAGAYSWSGVAANLSGIAVVQEGVGAYTWAGVNSVLANLAPAISTGGGASGAYKYRQPAWWGGEKKKKLLKKVEAVQLQIEKKREQIDFATDLFRIQRLIEQISELQKRMMKLLEQIDELNKLAGDEEAMLIYTIYRSLH